ncbi:efflux transporter outer membrane subunit [Kiloniella litopenaei]|uniref:efflux transporter outer membrane subunit n=1 Tax=Kiloniella litopenaei TaxID=1549748 RepID=UPI003BACA260
MYWIKLSKIYFSGFVAAMGVIAVQGCVLSTDLPDYKATLPKMADSWSYEQEYQVDKSSIVAVSQTWFTPDFHQKVSGFIVEGIKNNPELKSARARLEQQIAQYEVSESAFFPKIDLSGDASRTKSSSEGPDGERIKSYENSFKAEARVSWEIDVWGRLESESQASYSSLLQRQRDVEFAQLSVATRIVLQWIELIALEKQLDIARQEKSNLTEIVERTQDRYQQGVGSILDLRLVETDLANADSILTSKINEHSQAVRKLELILGRYPVGKIQSAKEFPKIVTDFSAGIPSDLLVNRPDLLIAEQKVIAAHHNLNAAKANRLPRLSLTQSTSYQNRKLSDLFDPYSLVASIAGNIIQPLYDGGQRRAVVAQNKAIEDETIAEYVNTALKAFDEVENYLGNEIHLKKQEEELSRAALMAEQGQNLSRQKYYSGLIPILDLLQAQQRFFVSKSRLINIQKQRLLSRVNLYLALGGHNTPLQKIMQTDPEFSEDNRNL